MKYTLPLVLLSAIACAQPSGMHVVSGTAELSHPSSDQLNITVSDKAHISWKKFCNDTKEITEFIQPSSTSICVNTVCTWAMSHLKGTLKANGTIYLINKHGIVIGPEATITAGSFVGSTFPLKAEDLFEGKSFEVECFRKASLENSGNIRALHGDVVLMAYKVEHTGSIEAPNGKIEIGAGLRALIQPSGEKLVYIQADLGSEEEAHKAKTGIDAQGSLKAMDVQMTADGNLYSLAINQEGTIDATHVSGEGGRIILSTCKNRGTVELKGTLNAVGKEGKGGSAEIFADRIYVREKAGIDVSGKTGGGSVMIGGTGKTDVRADYIEMLRSVDIKADATGVGPGGTIITWAKSENWFYSDCYAKGSGGGTGGFVEISSNKLIVPRGYVYTKGDNSPAGTVLYDPAHVEIGTAPGHGTEEHDRGGAVDFSFTESTSYIHAEHLQTLLQNNHVVIDTATGGQSGDGAIVVGDSAEAGTLLTWPDHTLTLKTDAGSLSLNQSITATGSGAVVFEAPAIEISGALVTAGSGGIDLKSGDLTITGQGDAGLKTTDAGAIQVKADAVKMDAGETAFGRAFISASGDLSLDATSLDITSLVASGEAFIDSVKNVRVSATGDINLKAQGNRDSVAFIESYAPTGIVTTKVTSTEGKIIMDASFGSDTSISGLSTESSDVFVSAKGGISLLADGSYSDVVIESKGSNVTITSLSGGLELVSKNGGEAYIETPKTLSVDLNGSIDLDSNAGASYLRSIDGELHILYTAGITCEASSDAQANSGYSGIRSANALTISHVGNVKIDASGQNTTATLVSDLDALSLDSSGSLLVAGHMEGHSIIGAGTNLSVEAVGDINVEADNGGSATIGVEGWPLPEATVKVSSIQGNILLSGTHLESVSSIQSTGSVHVRAENITQKGMGFLSAQDIDAHARGIFTLTDYEIMSMKTPSLIVFLKSDHTSPNTLSAAKDFVIENGSYIGTYSARDLILKAGGNILMGNQALIDFSNIDSNNHITLVCDKLSSSFNLVGDSQIKAPAKGELRIYTSSFSGMEIEGKDNLNGGTFEGVDGVPDAHNHYNIKYGEQAPYTGPWSAYYTQAGPSTIPSDELLRDEFISADLAASLLESFNKPLAGLTSPHVDGLGKGAKAPVSTAGRPRITSGKKGSWRKRQAALYESRLLELEAPLN